MTPKIFTIVFYLLCLFGLFMLLKIVLKNKMDSMYLAIVFFTFWIVSNTLIVYLILVEMF